MMRTDAEVQTELDSLRDKLDGADVFDRPKIEAQICVLDERMEEDDILTDLELDVQIDATFALAWLNNDSDDLPSDSW